MNEIKFLEPLIRSFEKLPGVGQKTATRYAFQVVEKLTEEEVEEFVKVLTETKQNVKHCAICNILTTTDVCDICDNELREKDKILVVKDTKDVISLERTKQYNGLYHVLGGLISPLDGIGPDELAINELEERCKDIKIKEVIIATNPTTEGETTALYIAKLLEQKDVVVTRIAYGVPMGANLDYTDEFTILKALEGRRKIK